MSQRLQKLYEESPKRYGHDPSKEPYSQHGVHGIAIYICECCRKQEYVLNPTTYRMPQLLRCPFCDRLSFVRMKREGWAALERVYPAQKKEYAFTIMSQYDARCMAEAQHQRIYGDKAHQHTEQMQLLAESLYNNGRGIKLVVA